MTAPEPDPLLPRSEPNPDSLPIAGLVPLSTCDWPGRLAATVFCQGCPWNCGYCHNPELIDPTRPGSMSWSQVVDVLERRRGLLDAVVFSGGEPTLQPALGPALREVRELGFATGLHTSGAFPKRLALLVEALDWIGLDIKAIPEDYPAITRVAASADKAFASLEVVLASGIAHEVRITVDPTIHTSTSIHSLLDLLRSRGAHTIVLQEVRANGTRSAYKDMLASRGLGDVLTCLPPDIAVRRPA